MHGEADEVHLFILDGCYSSAVRGIVVGYKHLLGINRRNEITVNRTASSTPML